MRRATVFSSALALAALTLVAAPPAAQAKPLSAADRLTFISSPQDVLKKKFCSGTKLRASLKCRDRAAYVKSNELYHDVWRPYVSKRGGGYIGVGSGQNYTLIAWQRAKLVWLMDYDPRVVRFNKATRALILAAPTVKAYLKLWEKSSRRAARRAIYETYAQLSRRERRLTYLSYLNYRETLRRHLRYVMRVRRWRKMHWLHDAADYAYIRKLHQDGRVRIIKGDLLGTRAMVGIGNAARRLKVPIRTLYTSNAEEFWRYTRNFRANVRGLPMDTRSIVLRTRHTSKYGPRLGYKFIYIIQGGRDFQQRLAKPANSGIWAMMAHRRKRAKGVYTIGIAAAQHASAQ